VQNRKGSHCAVGNITYSTNPAEDGLLFYFKASLSGDENDVILDYKRKHPDFPHETTIDQFFGEQQLEAYRALGFHMLHEMLDEDLPNKIRRNDTNAPMFAVRQRTGDATLDDTKIAVLTELRAALRGMPVPAAPIQK
jgi:hypothetical protein